MEKHCEEKNHAQWRTGWAKVAGQSTFAWLFENNELTGLWDAKDKPELAAYHEICFAVAWIAHGVRGSCGAEPAVPTGLSHHQANPGASGGDAAGAAGALLEEQSRTDTSECLAVPGFSVGYKAEILSAFVV